MKKIKIKKIILPNYLILPIYNAYIHHIIGYQKIDELSGIICISQLKEEMNYFFNYMRIPYDLTLLFNNFINYIT